MCVHAYSLDVVLMSTLVLLCPLSSLVPSAAPEDVEGTAIDSQTLRITWSPPPLEQQNGDILGYRLLYTPADSGYGPNRAVEIEKRADERSATLASLQKWTSYKVWVKAYTSIGDGPLSSVIVVQTDEDGMWNSRCTGIIAVKHSATTYIAGFAGWLLYPPYYSPAKNSIHHVSIFPCIDHLLLNFGLNFDRYSSLSLLFSILPPLNYH